MTDQKGPASDEGQANESNARPPDNPEEWGRHVQAIAREVGFENAPAFLQFSFALALREVIAAVSAGFERWAAFHATVEAERAKGEAEALIEVIRQEGTRLHRAEDTRRMILGAIVLVTIGTIIAGAQTGKLVEAAAVLAAFGGLLKVLVGDTIETSLAELAEPDAETRKP